MFWQLQVAISTPLKKTGIIPVRNGLHDIDWGLILRKWERVASEELGSTETSTRRGSFNRTITADCWRVKPVDWRTKIKPQQEHSHDDEGRDYRLTVRNACTNIYFFMTKDGRFGLGPPSLEEGDTIAVLLGGKTPFILRPCVNRRSAKIPSATYYYKLVGEAFVDGLMYQDGSLQDDGLRDFLLI